MTQQKMTKTEEIAYDLMVQEHYDEIENKKNDKLFLIFKHQKELQEKLGIYDKIGKDDKLKQQYINQMILALHEEATEIMRETCYKNPEYMPFGWKKGQKFNNENFKDEIIDIIHFVMNLCIISGMDSDEIYNRYIGKQQKNIERQRDGY
mgnify:CR=1 FL=1